MNIYKISITIITMLSSAALIGCYSTGEISQESDNESNKTSNEISFESQAKLELDVLEDDWNSFKNEADSVSAEAEAKADIRNSINALKAKIDMLSYKTGQAWVNLKAEIESDLVELKSIISLK